MLNSKSSLIYFKNIKILLNNHCYFKLFIWCAGLKCILYFNFLLVFLKLIKSKIYITTFKINFIYLNILKSIMVKKLLGTQKQYLLRVTLFGMGYKLVNIQDFLFLSIGYSHLIFRFIFFIFF
jgi:hypothetical protein